MKIQIHRLNNIDDPALKVYASTNEANLRHIYEPERGIFIAESLRVISRALDAGCEPESFLLEEKYLAFVSEETATAAAPSLDPEELSALERIPSGVPVFTAPIGVLEQITGYKLTRGALAAMRRPEELTAADVLRGAKRVAVFEHITNPTNVGALFRSAAALGMEGILLTGGSADPLNRRAIRVSMGSVFSIPWSAADEDDIMETLHKEGFTTAALALTDDAVSPEEAAILANEKIALFLGAEDDGLSEATVRACDHRVKFTMRGGVDSLNVSNAGAIAFYIYGRSSRFTR